MVTMKDVAKRAGVSTATVSYVLNNSTTQSISSETRARVLKACKELNYTGNMNARALSIGKSFNVGVFLGSSYDGLYTGSRTGDITIGVNRILSEAGYSMMVELAGARGKCLKTCLQKFRSKQIDGAIVIGPLETGEEFDEELEKYPIVIIDEPVKPAFNYVSLDERDMMKRVVKSLADEGCKNIGLIVGSPKGYYHCTMTSAYAEALEECGLEFRQDRIVSATIQGNNGYEAALYLLSVDPELDAIIVSEASVVINISVLAGVASRPQACPKKLFIVAYAESKTSRHLLEIGANMGISYKLVEYDLDYIGEVAGRMVLDCIHADRRLPQNVVVKGTII